MTGQVWSVVATCSSWTPVGGRDELWRAAGLDSGREGGGWEEEEEGGSITCWLGIWKEGIKDRAEGKVKKER